MSEDPSLVHARGGDGQTPLHFAQTAEMAEFLLDRGADINARDIDHESTPAQYMVRDRQEVARFLVTRGGRTDILMASALGDRDLVTALLEADPGSIETSVSEDYFPRQDPRAGGTIYIWTLGAGRTAHVIAREFGHEDVFRLLMDRSRNAMKLAMACELGDEALSQQLRASHPNLAETLTAQDRRRLLDAARDNNTTAVRLMLDAGWPVDARGQDNATSLHWAGFHGNAEMARELIRHHAPIDVKEDAYNGTPLGWAAHGSVHGWHCTTGDYAATAEALLAAGAEPPHLAGDLHASQVVLELLRRRASR